MPRLPTVQGPRALLRCRRSSIRVRGRSWRCAPPGRVGPQAVDRGLGARGVRQAEGLLDGPTGVRPLVQEVPDELGHEERGAFPVGAVSGEVSSVAHEGPIRSFTGNPHRSSTAYWLSAVEDRNGNSVHFARRADGAPTAVTPLGRIRRPDHRDRTRVTDLAVRGPGGPTTVVGYGYDQAGHLTALTGPDGTDGAVMSFTYDGDGRVTSWTDRNAFTFRYVYDTQGRVAGTVGPEGTLSSTFAYDVHPETGQPVTHYTDSTGATSVLHFNDRLQVVAESDPLDGLGNCTGVHAPDGTVKRFTHDRTGAVATMTDALGGTARFTSDAAGLTLEVRDDEYGVTRVRRDHRGPCGPTPTTPSAAAPPSTAWQTTGTPWWRPSVTPGTEPSSPAPPPNSSPPPARRPGAADRPPGGAQGGTVTPPPTPRSSSPDSTPTLKQASTTTPPPLRPRHRPLHHP
ncbi:hypothetical protein [Streptomyces sp. NPDC058548]|uniref:hypothetical protein n=1 Tax=Streptomyces sp. NPDC058548 TaxID=3346545 RepID=UPI00364A3E63